MNKVTDPNRLGDVAEYYAVTFLWDLGYEVYHNCGCTGPVDLIAMDKDGKILLIDVKTERDNHGSGYSNTNSVTEAQKKLGVQILAFNPITRKLRFLKHRHETGHIGYRDEQPPQFDLDLCDAGC